jgi:hypothetical protein
MRYLVPFAVLVASVPVPLNAQQEEIKTVDLPHPASYLSGAATEAQVGRFDANAGGDANVVPDVAVLQGGDLCFATSPDRVYAFTKVAGPFTSLARVALASPAGRDGVLVTSGDGVELVAWDDTEQAFASTTVLEDANWESAEQLQAFAGTPTRIYALSSSHETILCAEWDGEELAHPTSLAVSTPLLALAVLDWDGDPNPDFACDDGSGLRILDSSGTPYGTIALPGTAPRLLRLPVTGGSDGVLWLTDFPFPPYGQVVGSVVPGSLGAPTIAQMQPLSPWNVQAMTLARFDADAEPDVVLSYQSSTGAAAKVYFGTGDATFAETSDSEPEGVELSLSAVWNTTGPAPAVAAGDLDGDGDDDLLYAGDATLSAEVRVVFANGVDQTNLDDNDHLKAWINGEALDTGTHLLTVYPWALPTSAPGNVATHIHVRVFRAITGGKVVLINEAFAVPPVVFGSFHLSVPNATSPEDLYFEFSYVRRVSGQVVQAFPAWIGLYRWDEGPDSGGDGTGGFIRPPPPPTGP